MRFRFKIRALDGRYLLSLESDTGADDGGPAKWFGIAEFSGDEGVLCFAREDHITIDGWPERCKDADPRVYTRVTLKRRS